MRNARIFRYFKSSPEIIPLTVMLDIRYTLSLRNFRHRRWHLDEVFVKINGVKHYRGRAVDHEGEVLESFITKRRDKKVALKLLRKSLKRRWAPRASSPIAWHL